MTTHTCVAQYTISQKAKEKKRSTQNCCRRFLASAGKAGGQRGFLEFFSAAWHPLSVPVLWARRHGHLLALWPAALERGRGACRDGRARNMFRRVCLETGGLGQRADQGEDGAKHSWQTRHTHSLTHSHSLVAACLVLHQLFPLVFFSPSFAPHALPSSPQGSEITL